ncbi:hypothetical protein N7495_002733 [Penicillium taxi]|uniref:uncharacterized protein n=1 Tax=Penicillium taxi TaxID=168475 RepID=UPI002544E0D4|nr:uncharacterized protein N7495_002733 [Penicillium taxi]KAJ5902205.1 hypothetical protein N7495_002733 [Penicillium taxi]
MSHDPTTSAVAVPSEEQKIEMITQDAQRNSASVLKRKPVPAPVPVAPTTAPELNNAEITTAEPPAYSTTAYYAKESRFGIKRRWPFAGVASFSAQKRSRKLLILGIIAAIVLIALIIGLAVGLTVGKNKHSNLALPTANGGPYSGDLTYYDPGLGSCGITSSESDSICAVSHILFDAASTGSNPNDNPLCGLKIRLRRDGTSVDVKVVDRCVGCKETDLDVTESVFEKVAAIDLGRVTMEWAWLENSPVNVSRF